MIQDQILLVPIVLWSRVSRLSFWSSRLSKVYFQNSFRLQNARQARIILTDFSQLTCRFYSTTKMSGLFLQKCLSQNLIISLPNVWLTIRCGWNYVNLKLKYLFTMSSHDSYALDSGWFASNNHNEAYLSKLYFSCYRFVHEGVRYPCDACSYEAPTQSALKTHMQEQ